MICRLIGQYPAREINHYTIDAPQGEVGARISWSATSVCCSFLAATDWLLAATTYKTFLNSQTYLLQKLFCTSISATTFCKVMWCAYKAICPSWIIAMLFIFTLYCAMLCSGSDFNMSSSKSPKYSQVKNWPGLGSLCKDSCRVWRRRWPLSSHSLPSAAIVTQSDCSLWLNSSCWTILYS